MKRFAMLAAVVGMFVAMEEVQAQVYEVYYPSPVMSPVTTYYSPAPAIYAPVPTTTYYAPATTAYYSAAAPVYSYRPMIGGTVSGWRYNRVAVPVAYPTTVAYYPAW